MRSLSFTSNLLGVFDAQLPASAIESSFLQAKIKFLIDLFSGHPPSETISALTTAFTSTLLTTRVFPAVTELRTVVSKIPLRSSLESTGMRSDLDLLITFVVDSWNLYSERAVALQKQSHLAEELVLLQRQFALRSAIEFPYITHVSSKTGRVPTPYWAMIKNLRSILDALETERKISKLVFDSYASLETQILAIIDWFAKRNRDRTLLQVTTFCPSLGARFSPWNNLIFTRISWKPLRRGRQV